MMFALTKLLEVIIGIGGGVVFEVLYDRAPKGMGFVVALLLFMLWELIEAAFHAKQHHRTIQVTLARLAGAEAKRSAEQTLVQLGLAYACREVIGRAETADVWNRLTWAVQHSYQATNYIDIPDLYQNRYADNVLSVQKAKVRALKDFRIRKVFISKTEEELTTPLGRSLIKEHCEEQTRMDIRSLLYERIDPHELAMIGGKKNLDFAIFDAQVVLIWHLDDDRKITGSNVLVGEEVAKKFDVFFEHLFTAGGAPPHSDSQAHHGKAS